MSLPKEQINRIIEGCLRNERQPQKQLFEFLFPILMRIARRYFHDPEDCKDSVQEAFIKIFSHLSGFKGESALSTWATRITINHILYKLKQKERDKLFSETISEETATFSYVKESETIGGLLYEDLLSFINKLPQGKKVIFNLFVIDGFTHKEIAEMLNITEGTSKAQLSRAKEMLTEMHRKHNLEANARTVY